MTPTLARTLVRPALLAGLCVFMGLATAPVAAQEAALVGVDAVREEPYKQTVEVIGRLVSRRAGVVAARTRGPVGDMRVDVFELGPRGDGFS